MRRVVAVTALLTAISVGQYGVAVALHPSPPAPPLWVGAVIAVCCVIVVVALSPELR